MRTPALWRGEKRYRELPCRDPSDFFFVVHISSFGYWLTGEEFHVVDRGRIPWRFFLLSCCGMLRLLRRLLRLPILLSSHEYMNGFYRSVFFEGFFTGHANTPQIPTINATIRFVNHKSAARLCLVSAFLFYFSMNLSSFFCPQ